MKNSLHFFGGVGNGKESLKPNKNFLFTYIIDKDIKNRICQFLEFVSLQDLGLVLNHGRNEIIVK